MSPARQAHGFLRPPPGFAGSSFAGAFAGSSFAGAFAGSSFAGVFAGSSFAGPAFAGSVVLAFGTGVPGPLELAFESGCAGVTAGWPRPEPSGHGS